MAQVIASQPIDRNGPPPYTPPRAVRFRGGRLQASRPSQPAESLHLRRLSGDDPRPAGSVSSANLNSP